MEGSGIRSARTLGKTAKDFEAKRDWKNAAQSYSKAADKLDEALLETEDTQTVHTLQTTRDNYRRKSKDFARSSLKNSSSNAFDMRKLEQEIHAIQEESHQPMSDSYTEDDDLKDPFNQFWDVVEPMMDKLSDSIATTSNTVHKDDYKDESERIQQEMALISESFFCVADNKEDQDQLIEYTNTSNNDSENTLRNGNYRNSKQENEDLKIQIIHLHKQIQNLEMKTIDNTVLKSSIIQFKNDVHKQALRILQTQESTMMTRSATTTGSSLSKNIRHVGSSTAEIVNKTKELEEANRILRSQNRKQDALMNKYRERWERLKEGAKKRQPSNSTSTLLSSLASNSPPVTIDSSSPSLRK